MQTDAEPRRSAHVIVFGNEKGGTGKSTICMNVLAYLLKSGQKVATIDLDSRQGTLTSFVENRREWSRQTGIEFKLPRHFAIHKSRADRVTLSKEVEFGSFVEAINEVERDHDFLLIDTPASDTYLMRLAHSLADTLVTPMNDSRIDFDVLAKISSQSNDIVHLSHYALLVREARRQRRIVDDGKIDWVIVRNRISETDSQSHEDISDGMRRLASRLGFRLSDNIAERPVFREFFLKGLTAQDQLDETTMGATPRLSHLAARQELRALMVTLRLPMNNRAIQRLAARKVWKDTRDTPLEMHDILDL